MPHPFGLEVVFSELFRQGVVHVFDEHFPKMMEGYMQLGVVTPSPRSENGFSENGE